MAFRYVMNTPAVDAKVAAGAALGSMLSELLPDRPSASLTITRAMSFASYGMYGIEANARDAAFRVSCYEKQPGHVGWVVTVAAYVDVAGSWHLHVSAVQKKNTADARKLAGHALTEKCQGNGAAAYVYSALAYTPGDHLYEQLSPNFRHVMDEVRKNQLDSFSRGVLLDTILDEPTISDYDRGLLTSAFQKAAEAVAAIEASVSQTRKAAEEAEKERRMRLDSETYEEREAREAALADGRTPALTG